MIYIEEMMMKCMYGKRIIVAMGYRNMKGLSMLQVFDKAHNSVNYTQYISMAPALHFVNSVFQNKSTVFILKKKNRRRGGSKEFVLRGSGADSVLVRKYVGTLSVR